MKYLISIYVSLFLILYPLQAQSKERAKIYLKSGIIVEGSIVKINESSIIFRELRDSGEFYESTVNNSMIFKLISKSGEVLILNHEFEDDFKEGEQRNKKLAIELSKKHSQIRNVSWQISTSNGETFEAITVQFIGNDTLKIKFIDSANISYTKSVALEAVNEIRIKKKTRTSEYSLRFMKIGFWIGEIFAALIFSTAPTKDTAFVFIVYPFVFVPPAIVLGAISGAAAGKDDVYKLSGKSDAEKFIIIEKIPNE